MKITVDLNGMKCDICGWIALWMPNGCTNSECELHYAKLVVFTEKMPELPKDGWRWCPYQEKRICDKRYYYFEECCCEDYD